MSKSKAAKTFGVSRTSIHAWLDKFSVRGAPGLASRTRGRPKRSRLAGHQAATTVRLIADRCPDQLKMPFALWTREAVAQLIADRYDIQVSVWTAGRYLKKWGFTPQKPLRRAYERNPVARRTGVVAKLIADMENQMARGAQAPGAKELAAAF